VSNDERPSMADLEQLAADYPETATFLRSVSQLAEHSGQAAQQWAATSDEPCDVMGAPARGSGDRRTQRHQGRHDRLRTRQPGREAAALSQLGKALTVNPSAKPILAEE
jgi:hypothetical protein